MDACLAEVSLLQQNEDIVNEPKQISSHYLMLTNGGALYSGGSELVAWALRSVCDLCRMTNDVEHCCMGAILNDLRTAIIDDFLLEDGGSFSYRSWIFFY